MIHADCVTASGRECSSCHYTLFWIYVMNTVNVLTHRQRQYDGGWCSLRKSNRITTGHVLWHFNAIGHPFDPRWHGMIFQFSLTVSCSDSEWSTCSPMEQTRGK